MGVLLQFRTGPVAPLWAPRPGINPAWRVGARHAVLEWAAPARTRPILPALSTPGMFGYLGHELRSDETDAALLRAAADMGLTREDVLLWASSRSARFAMDGFIPSAYPTVQFRRWLREHLPELRAECAVP
jgi:hypothetical protein